ncbi:hypothetical protein [Natrinema altunense]|uniref:Uncharacterized protein n=2 Tax=Natrinema altunense TaxID=222984 RepID=L9ZLB8_NATA2|nr:hypothetical protein [Natrinema altunense]ELY87129.1 hypothetical protein C485_09442 [Natrinema altunense JCM 12890]RZH66971.1 hypothetical protein ELS17_14440 [Natrinema altunense]
MFVPPVDTLFEGTDGRYVTDWQIERRLRTGAWTLCLRQQAPEKVLVETRDGALLLLAGIEPAELPAGVEIRVADDRARVVDTRAGPSVTAPRTPLADGERSGVTGHEG